MSVAQPKHQAKEPIDLDVIIACRKRSLSMAGSTPFAEILPDALDEAGGQVERFNSTGRTLSLNDVRVVLMAQIIKRLSLLPSPKETVQFLKTREGTIEADIQRLHRSQHNKASRAPDAERQQTLWGAPSNSPPLGTQPKDSLP
jgi:hypothetical protein